MRKTPLFSTYRQGENRVTSSMLAVFERIDLGVVERLLAAASGEASLSFIEFANQFVRQSGSVPDASISSRFRYLFEVKTARNAVQLNQLREHLRYLDGTFGDERLFVLTPDVNEPTAVSTLDDRRVLWFNFVSLSEAINGLIEDPLELISEQARFLLRELQALFFEDGLVTSEDVVVVAARVAYPEYKTYKAYVCQKGRAFRDSITHMAFYTRGAIQQEVPRILARRDQVEFSPETAQNLANTGDHDDAAIAHAITRMLDQGVRQQVPYQVFILSAPEDPETLVLMQPIRNTKVDKSGQPSAWTQSQRYTSSEALKRGPATTNELDTSAR